MEDTRSPGYFYELTRVLKKFSGAMGELLANPAVRAAQDGGFPRMAPPPRVKAKLEMMEQQQQQQVLKQVPSPSAKRTEIPVRYKSPDIAGLSPSSTFFGGAVGVPSQLPTTATGGSGANAPRTPPPPPPSSHTAAAGSASPFGAASPSRGSKTELSQVISRSGSVTGMRLPSSGPGGLGGPGGAAGGGNGSGTGAGSRAGGNSGAGTGMDDAILI